MTTFKLLFIMLEIVLYLLNSFMFCNIKSWIKFYPANNVSFVYKMIRCIILKLIFYWQQKFLKNVFLSVKIVISTLFRNLSNMFLHVLYMRNIGEELRQLLEWKFSLIFLFLMFLSIPLIHSPQRKLRASETQLLNTSF